MTLNEARTAFARGDIAAAERAAEAILAGDPRNLEALALKGDCLARRGDHRAALPFYRAILSIADAGGEARLLDHARREAARIEGGFEAYLRARLEEGGIGEGAQSPRFRQAMEIVLGRRSVTYGDDPDEQLPTTFFYPGLPPRPFYEREEFPWLAALEAAAPAMRAELDGLLSDSGAFRPYMEKNVDSPGAYHALANDPRWSACYLWRDGAPVAANADRCPAAMAALASAPLPDLPGLTPFVLFSMLKPGAHIPPHSGILNTQLIVHIPLVTPPGCRLRVGRETRPWEPGKALIFNDSIEHEAWNGSGEVRVILLLGIWRPELEESERRALTALFGAIRDYRAG